MKQIKISIICNFLDMECDLKVEQTQFFLIAVSEAARKCHSKFILKPNRVYKIGRKSAGNDIHLKSPICSKTHCTITITDDHDVIMEDTVCISIALTSINIHIFNFQFCISEHVWNPHKLCKLPRCEMPYGDLIGFGCNTDNQHLKDKNDEKHFVYRLSIETGAVSSTEPIEILSDDN